MSASRPLKIALVAGEASGDTLGAGLIEAIRAEEPDARFFGIAGPKMAAAGCEAWYRAEELSVMGFVEVLPHLRRLLRLRRELIERIEREGADVFVGIDSSDFNLHAAARLKAAGVRAVQYVSPQVWAARQWRVKSIRSSVDLVLCLLPFEPRFYEAHDVNARFVGHPLADAIPLRVDAAAARSALGLPDGKRYLALLPGSRRTEVASLAAPFMATAAKLQQELPDLEVVVALASDAIGKVFESAAAGVALPRPAHLTVGRAREVLGAADVVLTASGTASLETLLVKRPMVVAYRMVPLSYWLVRRLGVAKLPHFSMPNLLAGRSLVPEFVQGEVRPDVLAPALRRYLEESEDARGWYDAFDQIHRELRCDASRVAARAILELVRGQGS